MSDAPMLSPSAGSSKKVALDQAVFGARFHESLVHQSVRAEQAARRRGTAATKTRAEVSGGGAKPWRKKGTGRARAGSRRSPLWAGGGTAFGPQPRSYTFKVNRKEQRAALRSGLSLHAQRGSLAILDAGAFKKPKTVDASDLLADWTQPRPTLVILDAEESAAALSFRNIARVAVRRPEDVGVADLLGAASLLVSETALATLVARVAPPAKASTPPTEVATPVAKKAAPPRAKTAKTPAKTAKPTTAAPAAAEQGESATEVA